MAIREYAVTHTHTHMRAYTQAHSQMPTIPGDKTLVAKWANLHKS